MPQQPASEDEVDKGFEFLEPWRCGNCNALMYNTTADGYPTVGAPVGMQVKPYGKPMRICSMCTDMYVVVLKNQYFKAHHKEWTEEQDHKQKLMFGKNYLDKKE